MFEIRGSEVYPTADNDRYDDSSWPVFEIRGIEIFPTIHNDHYSYTGSAAFEIRDGYAHPTYINDDDDGFDVWRAGGMSFGETMVALGVAAFIQSRANARTRRAEAAEAAAEEARSTSSAAPGWYPTEFGPRYWNGQTWTQSTYKTRRGPIATAWAIAFLTVGYMLPWAIAVTRRTSNSAGVGWICFLLGWTIVGWIAALVMACSGRATTSEP